MDYKIYKKDLKKENLEKIIVTIYERKKYYIITTLQSIEDFKKTGFLPYDKKCYSKKLALKLLKEA